MFRWAPRFFKAIVSLLKRRPKPPFIPDLPMLAGCERCKKKIRWLAGNRLVVHLIEDHKLPEHQAYDTVDWIMQQARTLRSASNRHDQTVQRSRAARSGDGD
jgi:hypothetical protein